jgi:hypothetical protein
MAKKLTIIPSFRGDFPVLARRRRALGGNASVIGLSWTERIGYPFHASPKRCETDRIDEFNRDATSRRKTKLK